MGNLALFKDINKILLVQLAGIGDLVMATPVISAVRERFPEAHIALLTTQRAQGLLESSKELDRIFGLDYKGRLDLGLFLSKKNWQTIHLLRQEKFDLVLNLYQLYSIKGALQIWLLFKLLRAKFTAGRDTDGRGFFFNLKIEESSDRRGHEVESNLRLLTLFNIEPKLRKPHLDLDAQSEIFIFEFLLRYNISGRDLLIGINPGSAWRLTRRWPSGRFAQVADEIADKYSAKIVLTGSPSEAHLTGEIASLMNYIPLNSAGRLNISQLKALIKRCNLYISTDSGPMHIAAALGTPLIAVFGPAHQRYYPYPESDKIAVIRKQVECQPCYRMKCNDHRCMDLITAGEVLEVAHRLLEKR